MPYQYFNGGNNTEPLLIVKNVFYTLTILLACACGYVADKAVAPLRPYLQEKVTSAVTPVATEQIKTLAEIAKAQFELVANINFYGFFVLCVIASYIYYHTGERKQYMIGLVGHFVGLCIAYFWVSDMLFVFKRHFGLLEMGQGSAVNPMPASLMIVPIKLLFAALFVTGFVVLIRSLRKNRMAKKLLENS